MVHHTQEEHKYGFALVSLEGLYLLIKMQSLISVHAYTSKGIFDFGEKYWYVLWVFHKLVQFCVNIKEILKVFSLQITMMLFKLFSITIIHKVRITTCDQYFRCLQEAFDVAFARLELKQMNHLSVFVFCQQCFNEGFSVVEHIKAAMSLLVLLVYRYVVDIGEKRAIIGLQTI